MQQKSTQKILLFSVAAQKVEKIKVLCKTLGTVSYTHLSTGENLPFLEEEYEVATENGGFQMNGRWSDNPIVPVSYTHLFGICKSR